MPLPKAARDSATIAARGIDEGAALAVVMNRIARNYRDYRNYNWRELA
jgi:hypothetical protein